MRVTFEKSIAQGSVCAPPSKSMAHRLLICAALSKGKSEISNLSFSEDVKATIDCLKALGADIKLSGNTANIKGIDFSKEAPKNELFCNESGSTLRFLIPICSLFDSEIKLTGTKRLMERSVSVYEELFSEQGLSIKKDENSLTVKGKLNSGKYTVRGDVSSQFISGLLFTLPLLENDSIIEISGDIESNSYILLTIKALASFGVRVSRVEERTILIKGNQSYKPQKLSVEGDFSNSAFLEAFNTVGGNVLVEGLDFSSVQGDKVYKELFELLEKGTPSIDISDCPDLAPVLMAVAAVNNGVYLTGTRRLKIKESDRGLAMALELSKFGIKVENKENTIKVHKGKLSTPTLLLNSHNDHRIVMALSVLCSYVGGTIFGAEAINKSFPDFFDKISNLGIKIKVSNQ